MRIQKPSPNSTHEMMPRSYAQALGASAAPSEAAQAFRSAASRASAMRRPLGSVTEHTKNQVSHTERTAAHKLSPSELSPSKLSPSASRSARRKTWAEVVVDYGHRTGWAPRSESAVG